VAFERIDDRTNKTLSISKLRLELYEENGEQRCGYKSLRGWNYDRRSFNIRFVLSKTVRHPFKDQSPVSRYMASLYRPYMHARSFHANCGAFILIMVRKPRRQVSPLLLLRASHNCGFIEHTWKTDIMHIRPLKCISYDNNVLNQISSHNDTTVYIWNCKIIQLRGNHLCLFFSVFRWDKRSM
jgi:hypothetical protein